MKKIVILLFFFISFLSEAQQLPVFTQFKSNHFLFNPALTGTKKNIDLRTNYRNQWGGFEDAPLTQCVSLNSRILKGRAGVGGFIYKDETGPIKLMDYSLNGSYHLRFSDVEFSIGAAASLTELSLNASKIGIHNSNDPSIDKKVSQKIWGTDIGAGMYLYNDRFSFGVSALNMLKSSYELYKSDPLKRGLISNRTHWYMTLGYNYSQDPDYLWEHTFLVNYVLGVPILFDYTLRMHYKKKYFVGTSFRMGDAIALHTGVVFKEIFQISYSYDIIISDLAKTNIGTNELMLVYSINTGKKKSSAKEFDKRKYQYLF